MQFVTQRLARLALALSIPLAAFTGCADYETPAQAYQRTVIAGINSENQAIYQQELLEKQAYDDYRKATLEDEQMLVSGVSPDLVQQIQAIHESTYEAQKANFDREDERRNENDQREADRQALKDAADEVAQPQHGTATITQPGHWPITVDY
jgi:hypothetical protein